MREVSVTLPCLNPSIKFKGGRFSDFGIFLRIKKGVAPPPNELSSRLFLGDTRYRMLFPLVVLGSAIY